MVVKEAWSLATMAALLAHGEVRLLLAGVRPDVYAPGRVGQGVFVERLAGYRFALRRESGKVVIVPVKRPARELAAWAARGNGETAEGDLGGDTKMGGRTKTTFQGRVRRWRQRTPMAMLQVASLLLHCGLLALVVYYKNTRLDTPFERFMDSQTWGVLFLFTLVGVGMTVFRDKLFSLVSILSPYLLLAQRPQPAHPSLSLAPAENPFVGLFRGIFQQRSVLISAVSAASVLARFAPLLLSNIPFRITQTWMTHVVTVWMTVGMLGFMVLTLVATTTLVQWPDMPADPGTLAGSMCYLSDSVMLLDMEGVVGLTGAVRRKVVGAIPARYRFGDITGMSGQRRIGVDYARDAVSLHKEYADE